MRVRQRFSRKSNMGRTSSHSNVTRALIDALEPRRLFAGETVETPIPSILASTSNPSSNAVTLNQYFFDSTLPGTLVTFTTSLGTIQVGLTDAATPLTVANFLSYVSSGEYSDTIFHRSVDLNTGLGGTPTAPGTIIQGGGYALSSSQITHIATNSPVQDEYKTELFGDEAGTLAMAKTSEADSATSEWYFNVTNNTELDTPTTDSNGNETSYTVFGIVISGMSVIDQIAALPTYDINSDLTTVPVSGLTEAQVTAGASISASNLVYTESVTSEPGTSYTVTSDNKKLVSPTVSNGVLSFAYGSGLSGTATINVTATNLDGTSTTTSFAVTVPDAATPTAGPVAANVTAPFVVTNSSENFNVLSGATDSLAGINPADTTIVTSPAHGTASVNTSNGSINYTPDTGYLGSDSLTYTLTDTSGNTSLPATVTLDAVPPAVSVTIGTKTASSLAFTEPDGVVGHLTISNGTALVTFTDYRVTLKTNGSAVSATGAGTDIASMVISDTAGKYAAVKIQSNGPFTLTQISSTGIVYSFLAPNATFTGTSVFGDIGYLRAAAAVDANLYLGNGDPTTLNIISVTNTNITASSISDIQSKQWLNTDGGDYTITTANISILDVSGTFAENLKLSAPNYDIFFATVGKVAGTWDLSGSIFKATLTASPASTWSLDANGLVGTLGIKGNLANQITAAAITTLAVSGSSTGSTIQTNAAFSAKFNQIGKISFGGPVTQTVVFSAGSIGSFSAASMTDSRIYAGVNLTVAEDGDLAASASDLSANATIKSVSLGRAATAFSDALISADIIGSVSLGRINTNNSGTPEGVSASKISSIKGTLVPGGALTLGPAQLKTAATIAAYEKLKKLTLGDFAINLI